MVDLRIDQAHLVGLLLGLFGYGFYLALFSATMYRLRRRNRGNKIVSSALWIMLVLVTAYYILATFDVYRAFITYRVIPGTLYHLNDWSDPIPPAKDLVYACSFLLADLLLVWRLYVIWPDNKLALGASGLSLTVLTVSGIMVAIYEVMNSSTDGKYISQLYHWMVAACGMSILNNILVTSCIAGRLWWLGRQVDSTGGATGSVYDRIIYVMIQSGFLYLLWLTTQLCLYAAGITNVIYLFLHVTPAIVATIPTSIMLQLSLRPRQEYSTRGGPTEVSSIHWATAPAMVDSEDSTANTEHSLKGKTGVLSVISSFVQSRRPLVETELAWSDPEMRSKAFPASSRDDSLDVQGTA